MIMQNTVLFTITRLIVFMTIMAMKMVVQKETRDDDFDGDPDGSEMIAN